MKSDDSSESLEDYSSHPSINIHLPTVHGGTSHQDKFTSGQGHSLTSTHVDNRLKKTLYNKENLDHHIQPSRKSRELLNDKRVKKIAVSTIENAWLCYQNKKTFKILKHAICAAESCLADTFLKRIAPREARLLQDKSLLGRVRFRFGGSNFPPMIFFKIFLHNNRGQGIQYMSGKKIIKSSDEAVEDSLKMMGSRTFYSHMVQDSIYQQQFKITEEGEIATLKDYMQYLACLDETPAKLGGKENFWRKLTLADLPRHNMFYDIVDYLYSGHLSPQLQKLIPTLMLKPANQEILHQHLQIVSSLRVPNADIITALQPRPVKRQPVTSRRSKQARLRAQKMRRMYEQSVGQEPLDMQIMQTSVETPAKNMLKGGEDEDWEHEADKLYKWTKDLSLDNTVATPRLAT